jgi:hypothetical protein
MFWKLVFKSTLQDWIQSCKRKDSFAKRLMYLRRLDAVIANMARQKGEKQ